MKCTTCGQEVEVGGEGMTHYYIGKEREKVIDEVVEKLDIILHKHCSSYRFITNELIEELREGKQ